MNKSKPFNNRYREPKAKQSASYFLEFHDHLGQIYKSGTAPGQKKKVATFDSTTKEWSTKKEIWAEIPRELVVQAEEHRYPKLKEKTGGKVKRKTA